MPHANLACGVASLAMLLRHCLEREYDYRKLAIELKVAKAPHEKGFSWGSTHLGPGVYFQDIVKWLQVNQLKFVAANIRTKQNFSLITSHIRVAPIMVGIRCKSGGHWVVLDGMQNGTFEYLDPWLKTGKLKNLSKTELFDDWDGTFIALDELPK
jgi:ABC-type bacteriocin/lantibiotic exporter with double-glycine peptidase domain